MDKTLIPTSASKPDQQQVQKPRWPLGVLSGGVIIDMLEHLSQTARVDDYALVLWLQKHYIEPFGRIDRLDGLIVANDTHLLTLHVAYERYIEMTSEVTRAQSFSFENLPTTVPKKTEFKKWWGSEMYAKNGVAVEKKRVFVGVWTDAKKWERKLWTAPIANGEAKLKDTDVVKKDDNKGKDVRKDSPAAVNSDV
ncbi:hypothetical protein DE146DRAFT_771989 [Phaeosphaeria sp. MPI-PUGE-AT-0046c]|nr:hypothetical protein DE146DRAFT_771989 [Phaeosphaeria sp. MPI-PUGE-AT-0046c]